MARKVEKSKKKILKNYNISRYPYCKAICYSMSPKIKKNNAYNIVNRFNMYAVP